MLRRLPAERLLQTGLALVVAGIALASVGVPSRGWSSVMVAGFAVLVVAAVAKAGAPRSRR